MSHDEQPPVESELPTAASPGDVVGQTIAGYRIVQKLGEGGMGIVYEAEQEKPVHRKVALKLIKPGMDTGEVLARFESERQALALMNHPSIARIFDGGATEEGRPYFAMELVHGEPLTAYCDKHRLTVRERLDLFLQVCEGVQHAHQKGIIHRDIKPSNILVAIREDIPVPKIIDFGVAKATSQRLTERTLHTQLGQRIGTPVYMSPEQAEMTGLDIDTRTDVYSLGVVLYELLAGAQPFDPTELRKAGFEGFQRLLREVDPPRPSTRVHTLGKSSSDTAQNRRVELSTLERELRGDLDWITMKALEKDRTRRYGSPSELAADIQRHLDDEPVLASPPNTAYRAKKFIRRHRVGVAVTALALGLLISFAAAMTVQSVRIARERDRADREAEKAKAVSQFLQESLGAANPEVGLGPDATALQILEKAHARIENSFLDEPEIRAQLMDTIGWTYAWYGRWEEAEPLLQSALQARRNLFGPEHVEVATGLYHLGTLYFDRGYYSAKGRSLAEEYLQESLAIRRRLLGNEHPDLVEPLVGLGKIRSQASQHEEAGDYFREAFEIAQSAHGSGSLATLRAQLHLARNLHRSGDFKDAELLIREGLETARRMYDDFHPAVSGYTSLLALLLQDRREYDEAESLWRECLRLDRELTGATGTNEASGLSALAVFLLKKRDFDPAEEAARESLEIYLRLYGADHALTLEVRGLIARIHMARKEYLKADSLLSQIVPGLITTRGENDATVARLRSLHGECLQQISRYREAEAELLAALPVLRETDSGRDRRLGIGYTLALRRLADLYEAWGKLEKAAMYREYVATIEDR